LRRPHEQANLDTRATFAREGGQQRCTSCSHHFKVDFAGGEQTMLLHRRHRQQGARLPAQLEVDAARIVVALPRRRVDVVLDRAGELAGSLVDAVTSTA